ncbi:hypothetical protein RCL_jg24575.t1 [Rhizophagus clarus]|uniref:Uncharacterized protein n=1 Tax=Rhizophagus clarus TaxID=94130 RepID=A0A8H3MGV3_9GLOM|nr:hypothetical protein RCL_jg24575.t1 [Rhizophagus clarus]
MSVNKRTRVKGTVVLRDIAGSRFENGHETRIQLTKQSLMIVSSDYAITALLFPYLSLSSNSPNSTFFLYLFLHNIYGILFQHIIRLTKEIRILKTTTFIKWNSTL